MHTDKYMRKITLCNPSLDSLVFSKKGERILSLIPLTAIPAVEQWIKTKTWGLGINLG